MNDKINEPLLKVTPKGDDRYRVSSPVKLWVVNRSWSKDKTRVEVCGVVESIERSVYRIEGRHGQWVRYSNHYHPLYTAQEFSELLANARAGKYEFFNNDLGGRGEATTHTEPAPFIYYDESGPLA